MLEKEDSNLTAKTYKNRSTIITRNGKAVELSGTLKDGDRVMISHIYSGG